jgi:hypothetical protein
MEEILLSPSLSSISEMEERVPEGRERRIPTLLSGVH